MLWEPIPKALVAHAAERVLPLPTIATAAQPGIDAPPSVKFTLPVGNDPPTVAVNEMLAPTMDGFADEARLVALTSFTLCDNVPLVEAVFPASPP